MMLRFFAFLVFLAITYSHPGIDDSYPYSDYYFACISGRYFGGLGFVSSSHPVSECVATCSGRSQMYSILTYVPNKNSDGTCCLGCSCADYETLEGKPALEPTEFCNSNFTEGTVGVCWSSCFDSVYCSFGQKLSNGECPTQENPEVTTTPRTTSASNAESMSLGGFYCRIILYVPFFCLVLLNLSWTVLIFLKWQDCITNKTGNL